jgi:hypothetical protein
MQHNGLVWKKMQGRGGGGWWYCGAKFAFQINIKNNRNLFFCAVKNTHKFCAHPEPEQYRRGFFSSWCFLVF